MKKLVVFDLDGTLTDTLENLAVVTNEALNKNGIKANLDKDLFKYFAGDGAKNLIKRAMEYLKCDMSMFDDCFNTYMDLFKDKYCLKVVPYPNIKQLVTSLKEKGVKISVYSNKPHKMAVSVIDEVFGKGVFDLVIGQRDGYPVKPDPCGVFEAIDMAGVNKDEVLYVGDTNTDVKTGKGAGVFVVGVTWGFRTKEELISAGADTIVNDPLEILQLLNK